MNPYPRINLLLISLIGGSWLNFPILALTALALFSTPLKMLGGLSNGTSQINVVLACSIMLIVAFLAYSYRPVLSSFFVKTLNSLGNMPIWLLLASGVGLRVIWILIFPAQPSSDGAVYLALAEKLKNGEPYFTSDTYAYWPPGYPLFLSIWISIFDSTSYSYLVANQFLFVVGFFGLVHLGKTVDSANTGRIAAALFAVWPNLVFSSGTPEKELLVLALLPWATSFIFQSPERDNGYVQSLVAGLIIGAATLVQPSLQFLPLVAAVLFFITVKTWRRALIYSAVLAFGAALIIGPWTYRNYQILGSFVLVATNGGSNLYRANNPLATGGYTLRGEIDLSGMSELESDREGKRLGAEWIRENKGRFIDLMLEKQIRFMGDDAVGVYTTLKVGRAHDDTLTYAIFKVAANAWWMLAWLTLSILILSAQELKAPFSKFARSSVWLWLYLFALHSVFESAGKYHVPVIWVICILIAVHANLQRGSGAAQEA